jgi:hypothetical protein
MKYIALNAVVAASAVQGYLLPPRTNRIDWRLEQKRQIVGMITSLLGKGGKVADPPGAAPKKVSLKSDSQVPGTKRVKLRYGPYSVPNMNKTSLVGEQGMLWNYPDLAIPKPCTECTIVRQWAGLEYPNGNNANIDTGMWLHHMVHFAVGPQRWDPTCWGRSSLPHVDVNASPSNAERYFSSGNERTIVGMDPLGSKTRHGYHLRTADKYAFIVDLMNMNMQDKTVYMTMYYDFVEGPMPSGWQDIKVVWFDVAQCGTSEVRPPKQNGNFAITSGKWAPNFEGTIVGIGGHLHDGGVELGIYYNPGQAFCTSKAGYAEKPEYISGGHSMGGSAPKAKEGHAHGVAAKHISSMTQCYMGDKLPIEKVQRGQSWYVQGRYDYSKFEGNKEANGKQAEIMAIALMYVAVPNLNKPTGGGGGGPSMGKPGKSAKGAAKALAA